MKPRGDLDPLHPNLWNVGEIGILVEDDESVSDGGMHALTLLPVDGFSPDPFPGDAHRTEPKRLTGGSPPMSIVPASAALTVVVVRSAMTFSWDE